MSAEAHSVLLVCTANLCRSPMAEGILRHLVEPATAWRVESAGTWGFDGDPPALNAQLAMSDRGIDISNHRSRQVTRPLLQEFSLILTMTRGHKEALQVEFPSLAERVYLLSEMIDTVFDIEDPIGGPLVEYVATADELEGILRQGLDRIQRLSSAPLKQTG